MGSRSQRGQSTVEFALCLPLVAVLVVLLVKVGTVAVDQSRLWHAAREGARVAAVDADEAAIRAAAESSGLSPLDVDIEPAALDRAMGGPVTVTVGHSPGGSVPLLGALLDDLKLTATATMRIETP